MTDPPSRIQPTSTHVFFGLRMSVRQQVARDLGLTSPTDATTSDLEISKLWVMRASELGKRTEFEAAIRLAGESRSCGQVKVDVNRAPMDANQSKPEGVFQVIYMSECVLPSESGAYADAIDQLLNTSRNWNDDHEITGALLFSEGYFAQVLEGPSAAIRALIGQIICDPRHKHLRLVERGFVPTRLFGNWSMAYTDGNEQLDLSIADIRGMPNASQGAAVLAMLRHIVTPDETVAAV